MKSAKSRLFTAELKLLPEGGSAAPSVESPLDQLASHDSQKRHKELLAAIAGLRTEITRNGGTASVTGTDVAQLAPVSPALTPKQLQDIEDADLIRAELAKLSAAIETTKREIVAVRYRDASHHDRIIDVTHELDAVVGDTEAATETILGNCEQIEKQLDIATLHTASDADRAPLEEISAAVVKIYEACNFQDISGQRITKVVNTLKYIEQRIEKMMLIWGGDDAFASVEMPDQDFVDGDKALLNGPARADSESAASQADIDAMFD